MAVPSWTKLFTNIFVNGARPIKSEIRTWGTEAESFFADLYDKAPATLGSVAGTNTVTASMTPTLDAYATGQNYLITPANTNTAAATLNINSVGAKNLFNAAGLALTAGEF